MLKTDPAKCIKTEKKNVPERLEATKGLWKNLPY